jgi:hypothetical protein
MTYRMSQVFLFMKRVRIRIFTALKLSGGDLLLLESGGTDNLLTEN